MKREVSSCQLPVASKPSYWPTSTGYWPLILLLCLVAGGKAILYDTIDPDCFWHLRVAEQLSRDGIGPIVDDISFASIKTPWTPYSWLAELGMKAIWDTGGFQLAVLVQAMMVAGVVLFVSLCATETTRGQNPMATILATVVTMFLALPYLSFRPVTFAILLLACCTWLLLRDRRKNERSRAVWLIVPITVLITNCHFFAILVPMWVAVLLVGAIWEGTGIRRYAVMLALTVVACCATPMLPGAIEAVVQYQFGDPMVDGGVIAEFQPIWTSPIAVVLILTWLTACAFRNLHTLARYAGRGPGEGEPEKLRASEWLWIALSVILLMRLSRFAPVVAPLMAATLAHAMPAMAGRSLQNRTLARAIICILCLGVIRLALALPTSQTPLANWINRHGPDTPGYPVAATEFVQTRFASGRVINEFTWGGFIAWKLGDRYQVLLDGRTQLYTPQFWKTMYLSGTAQSQDILQSAGAQAAILPKDRSRFRQPLLDLGWTCIYRDDRAEVLMPPSFNEAMSTTAD